MFFPPENCPVFRFKIAHPFPSWPICMFFPPENCPVFRFKIAHPFPSCLSKLPPGTVRHENLSQEEEKGDSNGRLGNDQNPAGQEPEAESAMFGIPFNAFHRYVGPSATFKVKLASLLTMVDAYGPEMNKSETVTLLNDMFILAPAALIDPNITWEEIDSLTVRATFTNAGNAVSAVVTFDSSGALVNFVSEDRHRTVDGKTYEQLRWSTPVSDWREFDGRKLPVHGEAFWTLPAGEFPYAQFELLDIQYNVTEK
jgi:hypothetical protein